MKDIARKSFLERCCEKKVVAKTLREIRCEKDVMRKTLWARRCEKRRCGKDGYEKNISDAYVFPILTMLNQIFIDNSRGIEGL